MAHHKKQVIDKDGVMKTVIKSESTRETRVKEHMHGRTDHIRTQDGDVRFVVGMMVALGCIVIVAWLLWLLLG